MRRRRKGRKYWFGWQLGPRGMFPQTDDGGRGSVGMEGVLGASRHFIVPEGNELGLALRLSNVMNLNVALMYDLINLSR